MFIDPNFDSVYKQNRYERLENCIFEYLDDEQGFRDLSLDLSAILTQEKAHLEPRLKFISTALDAVENFKTQKSNEHVPQTRSQNNPGVRFR
jgi:hypothetical protein